MMNNEMEMTEYVSENREFLARVLAHGGEEAQGYALAALANGGDVKDIEEIQRLLDDLKERVGE
ncbi:hypothetical protein [Haloferax sp. DFSO52]|uniref:hypothetical protein n=1 Tax=Haloferax sp. DFSO52 TaxID=3388505 RepID=UPI003A881B7B